MLLQTSIIAADAPPAPAPAFAAAAWAKVRHGLGAAVAGDVHPGHGNGTFVYENRARSNRSGADRIGGETRRVKAKVDQALTYET